MRSIGYRTPAWVGVGETDGFVWHVQEYVDGVPLPNLTEDAIDQLIEVAEVQAGEATEADTWTEYVWLVGTGQHPHFGHLADYSVEVRDLLESLLRTSGAAPKLVGGDMVHGDFNGTNFLFAGGQLLGVVDIASAASGSRAIDMMTLYWSTFSTGAERARRRLLRRIVDVAGWEGAAVLLSRQVQEMLAFPMSRGRDDS
jgi:Ser/Thr protein kinase RdoA (MazF antagonist)